jgi:guanylate kinase
MNPHPLLILTGPSCAGKSPLVKALGSLYPDWMSNLRPLVLYNSREPRPSEQDGVDYHFRARDELEAMKDKPDYVCMDVRGDFQVLDIEELKGDLNDSPMLFEGNPFIAKVLQTDPRLECIPRRSVFVSPVSLEEIEDVRALSVQDLITRIMRAKLERRTIRQKGALRENDLATIRRRSESAWKEIKMAPMFDFAVVNHDGEDSDNWFLPVLVGEARKATEAVFAGLTGNHHPNLEVWHELLD